MRQTKNLTDIKFRFLTPICNKAKRDMSYNEFIDWINKLTKYRSSK